MARAPQRRPPIRLSPAHEGEALALARALLIEYAETIGVDLSFQGFGDEVATLPGLYAPPAGRLYLATSGAVPAGCAGIRPLEMGGCELKRLYVRPHSRGHGIGRMLVERLIADAREIGYEIMRLDTLPLMHEARALYEKMGFKEIAPYGSHPVEGTRFLGLRLDEPRPPVDSSRR